MRLLVYKSYIHQVNKAYTVVAPGLQHSGEAKAARDFVVHEYSQQELLEGSNDKMFITEEEINEILDPYFISRHAMDNIIGRVNASLTEMTKAIAPTVSQQDLLQSLQSVKSTLQLQGAAKQMKINYELPYNEWLFELVKKKLCALGFAVYYRGKIAPSLQL